MTAIAYHYGKAVRRCVYQLCDLFNELSIKRYDPSGNVLQTIEVPIRFGPKDKLYEEINNAGDRDVITENALQPALSLPRMGLDFNGLTPHQEQMWSVNKQFPYNIPNGTTSAGGLIWSQAYMPIPTKFNYTLTLACKYLDDALQLYEQVYALFWPVLAIDMPLDELNLTDMQKWHVHVNSFQGPKINVTQDDNSYWTTEIDFDVKGWVYKYQSPSGGTQIHKVTQNVYQSGTTGHTEMLTSAVPSAISAHQWPPSAWTTMDDNDYFMRLTYYMP